MRQYGLEKLLIADELEETRRRHLAYCGELAERIRPMLTRAEQLHWHARAETELDNFRLALQWSLRADQAEHGLRLFSSLTRFWYKNMHWKEMVDWQERLAEAFRREGRAPTIPYARSFYGAGMLATNFDPPLGRRLCEQCVEVVAAAGLRRRPGLVADVDGLHRHAAARPGHRTAVRGQPGARPAHRGPLAPGASCWPRL